MSAILFYTVILLTNIIQGITGFAGTILAMPFAIILVGYDVGKPILNVLGLLSGIYVFVNNRQYVNWKELKKIVVVMFIGIISGILISGLFVGRESILYHALGFFVIYLGIDGLFLRKRRKQRSSSPVATNGLLVAAGIIHGIFVSGGPLLIGYLSKVVQDKRAFRATISTIWIFLNTVIMIDDIRCGLWTTELLISQCIAIPFLFVGMFVGTKLYHRMSQETFMKLTYILLFISGVSLLLK